MGNPCNGSPNRISFLKLLIQQAVHRRRGNWRSQKPHGWLPTSTWLCLRTGQSWQTSPKQISIGPIGHKNYQLFLESEHEKPVFTPAFRVGVARIFQNAKRLDFAVWLRGPKIQEPCSRSMLCLSPTDLFSIILYQNPIRIPDFVGRQAALLIAKTRSSNRPALAAEHLLSRKPHANCTVSGWWVIQ